MKWKKIFTCKVAALVGCLWIWFGATGCASTRQAQLPDWWARPHKHDDWHLYFTAEGISNLSYEDARRAAREIIRAELKEYLLVGLEASDLGYEKAVQNALTSPEFDTSYADEEGKVGNTFYVWVMGRYPVRDYNCFRDRFSDASKLQVAQEAFGGRTVGVYSFIRTNGKDSIDFEGRRKVNDWLVENGIQVAMANKLLTGRPVEFDVRGAKRMANAFLALQADVVLATQLDVDTAKTGTQIKVSESNEIVDTLDAKMTYLVVRTSDGLILAAGSTYGYSDDRSQLVNVILTHRRHLPSHAQAISKGLGIMH